MSEGIKGGGYYHAGRVRCRLGFLIANQPLVVVRVDDESNESAPPFANPVFPTE